MLYTVEEISELIGLSKVSIYRKLKLKDIALCTSRNHGVTYVTEEGLMLIKDNSKVISDTSKEVNNDINNTLSNEYIATDTDEITLKDDYILTLKSQLKEKDKQLENYSERMKQLIDLNKNSQILLKDKPQQDIFLLEEHFQELDTKLEEVKENMQQRKDQQSKGLFSKLFKK